VVGPFPPGALGRRFADPRLLPSAILLAVALASLAALLWPLLPFDAAEAERSVVGPTRVGVITKQVAAPGAAGDVGRAAPDFEWLAPDGKTVRLSGLRGATVVVNFWATWCEPCRVEMPELERAARADRSVRVLAVDLDESGDKIRAFFDRLALETMTPLLDVGSQTARRFGVVSLPTTFFIGPDGIVRHIEIGGPMSSEAIRRGIEKAR